MNRTPAMGIMAAWKTCRLFSPKRLITEISMLLLRSLFGIATWHLAEKVQWKAGIMPNSHLTALPRLGGGGACCHARAIAIGYAPVDGRMTVS
ncbi:MAG: hypothetical protein OXU96_09985 [Gammaproteobacteria bacterium]|nr:hypothetical protein [Gammaproteobacteria bacterium]